MKTDINALVQEAVLDCANPAGIFQKLHTTFSDLTSPIDQGSEIQKRLLDEGLTRVMPVLKDGVPHQEITGEGIKVIGLILIELKLDKNDSVVIESIMTHWLNSTYTTNVHNGQNYFFLTDHLNDIRLQRAFKLCDNDDNLTPRTQLLLEAIKKRDLK